MTDDLLSRASRALRDETEEADAAARFTRARVMAGLQQSQARRRTRLAFVLPLAACFAAATAFGMKSTAGQRVWHGVARALGFERADALPGEKTKAPSAPARSSSVAAPVMPVEAPAAPIDAPPAVEAPAPEPVPVPAAPATAAASAKLNTPPSSVRAPREVAPSAAVTPPESKPAEAAPAPAPEQNDPAHELYRVAHQSHFVDHDFASALRAWDAYLAAAPSGRFAPEARYNRALCLVRLGRKDDAERALRPFADGAYGSYRRDEAKALIEALQK